MSSHVAALIWAYTPRLRCIDNHLYRLARYLVDGSPEDHELEAHEELGPLRMESHRRKDHNVPVLRAYPKS